MESLWILLLRQLSQSPERALLLLFWVALVLALVAQDVMKAWRRWRRRRLGLNAQAAEAYALKLLEGAGFVVVESQLTRRCGVVIDQERHSYDVRIDALVRAPHGGLFVAECKHGHTVANPRRAATRRQLLEYQWVFPECEGVLLLDTIAGQILSIRFPRFGDQL